MRSTRVCVLTRRFAPWQLSVAVLRGLAGDKMRSWTNLIFLAALLFLCVLRGLAADSAPRTQPIESCNFGVKLLAQTLIHGPTLNNNLKIESSHKIESSDPRI